MPAQPSVKRTSLAVLLIVWLLSSAYLALNLDRGWFPNDEGTLGQAAERVLHGEIPNRDFVDPYTGGLAYLDALIFRLFGVNLFWLRLFLFAIFLIWVPALYAIAREFLSPWIAGVVTLVAVAWSVPNYAGAMPSWFCLFLATFGTFALTSYVRSPKLSWLILAGLCGGASFLIKSVALYYVAAALLFLVYREQSLARRGPLAQRNTVPYVVFLSLCLVLFVLSIVKLVFRIGDVPEFVHFVFPGLLLASLLVARERVKPRISSRHRLRQLLGMAIPFLLAAAFPVLLFVAFYWRNDGLSELIQSLFVRPFHRVLFARIEPYGLIMEGPSVLATLFLCVVAEVKGRARTIVSLLFAVAAAFFLASSRHNDLSYIFVVASAAGSIPILILLASRVLSSGGNRGAESAADGDQQLFLLASMTALFSLIQFPFAHLIYFGYVAPLAILLAANLISRLPSLPRSLLAVTAIFLILFGILILRTHLLTLPTNRDFASTSLALPRVGPLKVSKADANEYGQLIPFVKTLAGDNLILAGPDCPQVYFLSGLRNPTPILVDFLHDPNDYQNQMKSLVDHSDSIKVMVINQDPPFSTEELGILRSLANGRFPESREIGRFKVYWRP